MNWRRDHYGASNWREFIVSWSILLLGGPVALVLTGLAFKLMWLCVKFGWSLV